jgi:hypothetical protein
MIISTFNDLPWVESWILLITNVSQRLFFWLFSFFKCNLVDLKIRWWRKHLNEHLIDHHIEDNEGIQKSNLSHFRFNIWDVFVEKMRIQDSMGMNFSMGFKSSSATLRRHYFCHCNCDSIILRSAPIHEKTVISSTRVCLSSFRWSQTQYHFNFLYRILVPLLLVNGVSAVWK